MTVELNKKAVDFARELIKKGSAVADDRDEWSEHQPSAQQENDFIDKHGWDEYALWHLGVDDDANEATKGHYKFPYGDFTKVHRCGLLAAESRAGQQKYADIEKAAHSLHEMLDPEG
jgi:hypothetical protein